jgi:hypothetical protein
VKDLPLLIESEAERASIGGMEDVEVRKNSVFAENLNPTFLVVEPAV